MKKSSTRMYSGMTKRESADRQRAYMRIALNKDYDKECWEPKDALNYSATVRLYERFHNGRSYEEFLLSIVGGKKNV